MSKCYRSERDHLVERFRELAEELRTTAAVDAAQATFTGNARAGVWTVAAERIDQIVTEATTGRNGTATREEEDGTRPADGPEGWDADVCPGTPRTLRPSD